MTLGVDVGGTFTDLVWWDGSRLLVDKTPSTPDQSVGVAAGAARITAGSTVPLLVHGTTVATNALLEQKGATVALVTDPGFEDLLEIGRQDRPSLYDHDITRPVPLVGRRLRFGGVPDAPIDAAAVAVVMLDSYADPQREQEAAARVAAANPGIPVVMSVDVSGEFREYERTSTTVLTAYLRPVVEQYLTRLEGRVVGELADRLLVMQSNGGLIPAGHAGLHAASILLSGPAGGVVAAAAYGALLGHHTVVSFDMGGTSTDVCRIENGMPEVTFERSVAGYACRLPGVAVHTVGAGGGSIGWLDPGQALRVGPHSAGASPGPAAYARGGIDATVTDADLVVGRLGTDSPIAGGLVLDHAAAVAAVDRLGASSSLTAVEVAHGMIQVVETHMERAIRRVSVEEGFDPRGASLVAFGGAGGMHAAPLASRLGMASVIVPPHAGVFSALGLLLSSPRVDRARTVMLDSFEGLRRAAATLATEAGQAYREAVGRQEDSLTTAVDVRYRGQSHETSIAFDAAETWDAMVLRFHAAHQRRNGFSRPEDDVEVVTLRATASGRPALTIGDIPAHTPRGDDRVGVRQVYTHDGAVEAAVWRRAGLRPGAEILGPAVVIDGESTTWIGPLERGALHESGALVIERE